MYLHFNEDTFISWKKPTLKAGVQIIASTRDARDEHVDTQLKYFLMNPLNTLSNESSS